MSIQYYITPGDKIPSLSLHLQARKTVLNRLTLNFYYLENPMNYNSQVTLQLTLSLRNTSRILNPSAFNNA
jgi:hypothetical protein